MQSAIALMGLSVLIMRLQLLQSPLSSYPGGCLKLGSVFSFVGLVTVLLSTRHYFTVRHNINEDEYEPAARRVILFSLAVLLLGTGAIYYVLTAPFSSLSNFILE